MADDGDLNSKLYDVASDGSTVWVHAADGCCIGRFSRFGVDVHHDAAGQMARGSACLDCCHDLPPEEAWERFVDSMHKFHGVEIDDEHKPHFLAAAPSP